MNNTHVEELITRLQDADMEVRREAVRALAKTDDPAAVPALIMALSDNDSYVRRNSAEALGRIGQNAAIPDAIIQALYLALRDENWFVHERAAEALAKIGIRALPALISALRVGSDRVRFNAATALGVIGTASAIAALVAALRDWNGHVRSSAARALGRIGETYTVPPLLRTLNDQAAPVRSSAAEALGNMGDSDSLPRIILADPWFSTQQRIDVLASLRRAHYIRNGITSQYNFPDTRTLCQLVLTEGEPQAGAGARAVLNWLEGGNILLRGSQRDSSNGAQELLRSSQGIVSDARPEEMLRAADEPHKKDD